MDVVQQKLKSLLEQSDIAFEECKNNPSSEYCLAAYENAQDALDQFISKMHIDLKNRYK
ncbi:MAG: hypothetical protein ACI88A_001095 [Paraglaciecola sp.]|jgi:hypothetical protein